MVNSLPPNDVDKRERIRELNDRLRATFDGGRVVPTAGVDALSPERRAMVIRETRTFHDFDADNDPHCEHDFGSFDVAGDTFFWKIDYYAPNLDGGSRDPSDPGQTTRVLTIMLAEEY